MCWISVKTQLPEKNMPVDVFAIIPTKDGSTVNRRIADSFLDDFEQFIILERFKGGVAHVPLAAYEIVVTHWRHPPAPPEGM